MPPAVARSEGLVLRSEALSQRPDAFPKSECLALRSEALRVARSEGLMLSPSSSVPGAFLLENTPVVGSSKSRQII